MAIKQRPEDFVVREELQPAFLDAVSERPGRFALYELQKRGLTTHEALDALARRLGQPVRDISAAGLKDKQADTTQHVTVRVDDDRRLPPRVLEAASFRASQIGFVPDALGSQAIRCNHFRIVLRTLTRRAIDELIEAAGRLQIEPDEKPLAPERGQTLHITNYYGNQRFGSARAGQGFIAAHLVRGEFETALRLAITFPHRKDLLRTKRFKEIVAEHWTARDWRAALSLLPKLPERAAIERLAQRPDDFRGAFARVPYFFQHLCVEAYQSILWNRIATTVLIDRLGEGGRLWVVDDKFGQLVFPEACAVPADLIDLNLPVLGRRTVLVSPWKEAAERVLAEEGIASVDTLHIRGLDKPWFAEVPRRLFMIAEGFRVEEPEPDEQQTKARRFKVTTTFSLPRGGYATVLLRTWGSDHF